MCSSKQKLPETKQLLEVTISSRKRGVSHPEYQISKKQTMPTGTNHFRHAHQSITPWIEPHKMVKVGSRETDSTKKPIQKEREGRLRSTWKILGSQWIHEWILLKCGLSLLRIFNLHDKSLDNPWWHLHSYSFLQNINHIHADILPFL